MLFNLHGCKCVKINYKNFNFYNLLMEDIYIILFISIILYFIFLKKKIIPLENMKNIETHMKYDYNV